ncbi:MAG: hypothetical protein K5739_04500 [Lachnospiraceae bacterium]|nr:hypothetical protein [Lachnospiraceae bacterium]
MNKSRSQKIAVVFPGVGYTKDRPLLYYAGKLAVKKGYKLIHVDFSGLSWSKEQLKDRAFLLETLQRCLKMTDDCLAKDGLDLENSEVVFISKSIGTVVANAYAGEHSLSARQICFSPLEIIEDYVKESNGLLFYGDADPYADPKEIERIAKEKNLTLYKVSGGNHSLETGDVEKDIENLKEMMERLTDLC